METFYVTKVSTAFLDEPRKKKDELQKKAGENIFTPLHTQAGKK